MHIKLKSMSIERQLKKVKIPGLPYYLHQAFILNQINIISLCCLVSYRCSHVAVLKRITFVLQERSIASFSALHRAQT